MLRGLAAGRGWPVLDGTRLRFTGPGEAVVGSRLAWAPAGQC